MVILYLPRNIISNGATAVKAVVGTVPMDSTNNFPAKTRPRNTNLHLRRSSGNKSPNSLEVDLIYGTLLPQLANIPEGKHVIFYSNLLVVQHPGSLTQGFLNPFSSFRPDIEFEHDECCGAVL